MKVILISQKAEFNETSLARLKKLAEVKWYDSDKTDILSVQELYDSEEKILALSPVPIDWKFPKELYLKMRGVKYLCVPTTSTEFLDLDECKRVGITIANVPHYATESVAEQVIMLVLGLTKRLPQQIKSSFKYDFNDSVLGDDLAGKTLGVIGLGDIGKRVAEISKGLGLEVKYWSPNTRDNRFEYMNLSNLLSTCDILVPTISACKETENFLDKKKLSLIKDTAYFVSVINENVWDKNYLLSRISDKKLSGLAFESDTDMIQNFEGNVMVVPPFGWFSKQSLEENIRCWTDNIILCLKRQVR